MTAVDVLPDVPRLARVGLLTMTDLTSLVGQRISTRSPATIVYPYVVLQRIGGIPSERRRIDSARIQVDAWAETEGTASRVARVARACLHRLAGFSDAGLGVITGVDDDLGLTWLPDTLREPPTPRFVVGVVIHARAVL